MIRMRVADAFDRSIVVLLAVGVGAVGACALTDAASASPKSWYGKLSESKRSALQGSVATGAGLLVVGVVATGAIVFDSVVEDCNYFISWRRCSLQASIKTLNDRLQRARDQRDRLAQLNAELEALK